MIVLQTIPILRIFDYEKAIEFYMEWLDFTITFGHVFEEGMPKYIEIVRGGLAIHLSEHHEDSTPGTGVFFWVHWFKGIS